MKKTPKIRAPETTHVLRQVDLHHAPRTLGARGGKNPGLVGTERAGHAQPSTLSVDQKPPLFSPVPSPQWQAGHRQGYTEGLQAGLQQARQELHDQNVREGFDQGYEEGLAQARQQLERESASLREKLQNAFDQATTKAHQESQQTLKRLDQMIQRLPEQLSARMATMEDDMVALCFDMVCRILGDKLVTPQGIRELVCQATKDWPADLDLAIHLHPDDLQRLRSAAADALAGSAGVNMLDQLSTELERRVRPPLQWVPDAGLGVGGCVLRSSRGGLDARLMAQMTSLRDALLAVRVQRGDGPHPVDHGAGLTIADPAAQAERTLPSRKKGYQP